MPDDVRDIGAELLVVGKREREIPRRQDERHVGRDAAVPRGPTLADRRKRAASRARRACRVGDRLDRLVVALEAGVRHAEGLATAGKGEIPAVLAAGAEARVL